MRVAIFSDVHANLTALDAVLADIRRQTWDAEYYAGELPDEFALDIERGGEIRL